MNTILLDTLDFRGRRVIMTRKRWQEHIQAEHPELTEGALEDVAEILESPHFVYESAKQTSRHLYYRYGDADEFYRFLYLVVVVRYDVEPARVVTAYVATMPSGTNRRLIYCEVRR